MKKKSNSQNSPSYVLVLVLLLIGFAAGYFANSLMQPKQASAAEIEQAKNEIADRYKADAVEACWRVNNGSNLADGKYELTYRNIQINKQANRAIVTDCAENSVLLAKNSAGKWVETNVSITNFNRVNPAWQKACGIEDITVADDTVRPENDQIDQGNLRQCEQLDQL